MSAGEPVRDKRPVSVGGSVFGRCAFCGVVKGPEMNRRTVLQSAGGAVLAGALSEAAAVNDTDGRAAAAYDRRRRAALSGKYRSTMRSPVRVASACVVFVGLGPPRLFGSTELSATNSRSTS